MDSDLFLRLFEQINRKIDDISHSTDVVRNDVSAIKTRLFNGLTDTTRETYSKVLVLENKQEAYENLVRNLKDSWTDNFARHDTKEKMYHGLLGIIMAFLVTIFVGLLVFELEKYHILKIMAKEVSGETTHSGGQGGDNPSSVIGPP